MNSPCLKHPAPRKYYFNGMLQQLFWLINVLPLHSKRFTEYQRDNWHGQCQNTQKINYMGFGFKVDVNYTLIFKQEIFGILLFQNIRFSYHLPVLLPESHQHPLWGCDLSTHLCGLMGPNCSVQDILPPLSGFVWVNSNKRNVAMQAVK